MKYLTTVLSIKHVYSMNISFHSTTKPMKIVLNEYSSNHFILWSCYSLSNLSTHGLCGAMHESWVPLCHAFQIPKHREGFVWILQEW